MRINPTEHAAVEAAARRFLPPGSTVSLFGSRVDDFRRGGDIDLLVELGLPCTATETVQHRNRFTAHLYRLLGERRIDVLMAAWPGADATSVERSAVLASAREQAVQLVQV